LKNHKNIQLLDCTLRDGSYANHFQFTSRDTAHICSSLEGAGVLNIEVGHGLGVGASSPKNGIAFEHDIDYIKAAKKSVEKAKIGVFFIPEISHKDILKPCAEEGVDFVRVGVDPRGIDNAAPTMEFLLKHNIDVHLNLMKSYATTPEQMSAKLKPYIDMGLESVYVVDSAGCMLPNEVKEYVELLVQDNWTVGFHGHNNLDLANANSLIAVEAGATYVDGTLAGMGRSSGNAQTEVLSWILKKSGYSVDIDEFSLFELISTYLKPLMITPQGKEAIELVTGMAKFHTSFLPLFKRAESSFNVDLNKLIYNVSQIDCTSPSEELINSVAEDMRRIDE